MTGEFTVGVTLDNMNFRRKGSFNYFDKVYKNMKEIGFERQWGKETKAGAIVDYASIEMIPLPRCRGLDPTNPNGV